MSMCHAPPALGFVIITPPTSGCTVLTCNRAMDREARHPTSATLPEIWSPTWLPHEQLRLQTQGWRARLWKQCVSRKAMKATLCLRRGEQQLATGAQVYMTPRQGERKGKDRQEAGKTIQTQLSSHK